MNLSAYDIVMNKSQIKHWIDRKSKRLCSRVIEFFNYYYICKRYDSFYKCYDYYLVVTNSKFDDPKPRYTYSSKQGIVKFDIKDIWKQMGFDSYKDISVNLILEDEQEDCKIYKISI